MGPKNMAAFERLHDPAARRARIQSARHRGSMPAAVRAALAHAERQGRVVWLVDEVRHVSTTSSGPVDVFLRDGAPLTAHRVLLATGFQTGRPGGALVDDLVSVAGLPVAPCGYPLVGRDLRWHPRVAVMGPLAELELGPVSRNLSGAMRAGERIVGAS
jgi:hypothetical protein